MDHRPPVSQTAQPSLPLKNAPANATDKFLLGFLHGTKTFELDELEAACLWWRNDRESGETLVKFLVRAGVLVGAASVLLELMEAGYVRETNARTLLTADGPAILRNHRLRRPTNPAGTSLADDRHGAAPPRHVSESRQEVVDETCAELVVAAVTPNQSARRATTGCSVASFGSAALPAAGDVLGKCLIVGQIGAGAAGIVYRAVHKSLGIPVAVKLLDPKLVRRDASAVQWLRSEAHLLAQCQHPNIVRVYDIEDEGPFPFLVMELVDGASLADVIRQCGVVQPLQAVRIAAQIAAALTAAKAVGIVHRDIKPGNILLGRDGTAKLADLGLALSTHQTADDQGALGTCLYMAPEQGVNSSRIDHRADIYALGATLYEAVTGRPPFLGSTVFEILSKHVEESPVPPHDIVPEIPASLSGVILKMLAKAPGDRYDNPQSLADELDRVRAELDGCAGEPDGAEANHSDSQIPLDAPWPTPPASATLRPDESVELTAGADLAEAGRQPDRPAGEVKPAPAVPRANTWARFFGLV